MTMHNHLKRSRHARGNAMLLVLIAVAIATILALSFLAGQGPTSAVATNIDRKAKARAIAESALKMAIDYVNEDATWRSDKSSGTWMTDAALDGGTFTLAGIDEADGDLADDDSEVVTLSVVATFQGVTHRVSARVTPAADGPSLRLLLVATSDTSPTTDDIAKRTLFESWGYTVTLLDDSDSQATYDAAVAVNDVVFVSEQVSSSNVGTKLRDAAIGVVSDEGYLHDEFGFTTGDSYASGSVTTIDVVNNSHPITTVLTVGTLTVATSSMDGYRATSTVASGVTVLAEWPGTSYPVLMIAEAGSALHYGSAAGRRVMCFGGYNFDVSNLNADGKTILQRSLEWAAGSGSSAGSPTLLALYEFNEQAVAAPTLIGHWKLDEEPSSGIGGISANDDIDVWDSARIDSYDSSLGTYASQTPGTSAVVTTNSTSSDKFDVNSSGYVGGDGYIGAGGSTSTVFDVDGTLTGSQNVLAGNILVNDMSAPTGLPSSEGNFSRSSGNTVISTNRTFWDFTLSSSATVTISGNVTVWVQDDLLMTSSSQIIIPSGSSLTLYVADNFDLEDNSQLNGDSSATDRLTVYAYGEQHVDMRDSAEMAGTVYTDDDFNPSGSSHFYGRVLAQEDIIVEDWAEIHHDVAMDGFTSGGAVTNVGKTTTGSNSDTEDDNQAATQVVFTEAITVTSITAYLYGGDDGGVARFAIYEDNAGSPGNLIAQTGTEGLSEESWRWETEAIGPVNLSAGTYWLAVSLDGDDSDCRYSYSSGGSTHHHTNSGVDNGFTDPWGSSSATYSRTIAIYASGTDPSGGSVTTFADASTTANSGSVSDVTAGVTGFGDGGKAFSFDGSDDYIEVPHNAAYLLDAGSIGFHFYPTNLGGEQGLFSKDSNGYDDGGHLTIYTDGTRIAARIQTDGSDPYGTGDWETLQSGSGALSDNTWHHVLVTWGDGQLRLYLDGTLVDSENHLGGLGTSSGGTGNAEPIVIGANSDASSDLSATPVDDHFTGRVDDVRIYDLPLDASQTTTLAGGSDPGARTAPGYVVADTSGYGTAADLLVYDTSAIGWVGGGGLQFTGNTHASSRGAVSKLHDAIEANGEFAVELLITRASPGTTSSPSHIVGYTNFSSTHNFLAGQDGSKYEARVRDSATGNSGVLSPEFISTTDLASSGDTHLVLSYSGGDVTVFVNGAQDKTASAGGTLNNWDATHLLVLGGAYLSTSHWQGTIKRLAIYDEGFNTVQANNVYNGNDPGDGTTASGAGTVVWDEQD